MESALKTEMLCTRTVNRYAVAVGERDHETFAALFTEDGIWQRPGQPTMRGRDEIRAFMDRLPGSTVIRHVNGSVSIDVLGDDDASGISYTTVYNGENHEVGTAPMTGPDYVVEYRDRFRRVGSDWLIARRDTSIIFRAIDAADLPGIPNPNRP